MKALGAYLVGLRERAGLTQAQLVSELEGAVSGRTISRWENGHVEPYMSEIEPVITRLHGSMLRVALLMVTDISEVRAREMASNADNDLTPDELSFFSSIPVERRDHFRRFVEGD